MAAPTGKGGEGPEGLRPTGTGRISSLMAPPNTEVALGDHYASVIWYLSHTQGLWEMETEQSALFLRALGRESGVLYWDQTHWRPWLHFWVLRQP